MEVGFYVALKTTVSFGFASGANLSGNTIIVYPLKYSNTVTIRAYRFNLTVVRSNGRTVPNCVKSSITTWFKVIALSSDA